MTTPPTRLDSVGPPEREQPDPGRTRLDGAAPADRQADGTRLDDGATGAGPVGTGSQAVLVVLPEAFARRFEVEADLTNGAEADVVGVRDRSSGEWYVIKFYHAGREPDHETIRRIETLSDDARRGLVRVDERGSDPAGSYEVMEWCRHGSLRNLGGCDQATLIEVIAQLTATLGALHDIGVIHRDLKPENVFLRSRTPLELAVGDFGIVRSLEQTVQFTRAVGTPAYAPPEFESAGVTRAWDWWSLGMIVAELAIGSHPLAANGEVAPPERISYLLSQEPVDLSRIHDERIKMLCSGLLQRSHERRWSYPDVMAWLDGRPPGVVVDQVTPPRPARSVHFADTEFSDVTTFAQAALREWSTAARRLFEVPDQTLRDDLMLLLSGDSHEVARRRLKAVTEHPAVRLGRFLVEIDHRTAPLDPSVRDRIATAVALEISSGIGHIERLPRDVRPEVDESAVFAGIFEMVVTETAPQVAHAGRRSRSLEWWQQLSEAAETSISARVLAADLAGVARRRANPRRATSAGRPRPPRRSPLRRPALWVIVAVALVIIGAAMLTMRFTDLRGAIPFGSVSPSAPTVDESPPDGFEPLIGEYADLPDRSKSALMLGATGHQVEYLQSVLRFASRTEVGIDGVFGLSTMRLVEDLQRFVGLPATGVVDDAVWSIIDAQARELADFDPQAGRWGTYRMREQPVIMAGSEGPFVGYLQGVLATRPETDVPIDGRFGPETEQAVITLQEFFGLAGTGVVDEATWGAVNLLADQVVDRS